ncbi:ATP-binding cassette domain-containing protein [Clostridium sp. MCC353]|uniref:ABC transporter ATP-binding protein n=1 Tax=Clostridium sp. MCC353 TaxID=2592646 RepID=UPI001C013483|nr:ABC transporter ATP-binding protein [Clostridium sp. MCC353]MBT9778319.1 ATP-binding cassette domain-containing protein [Clostridium sp. MCC353]
MENAIEIKGLCKNYDGFSLKDVSFCLPKGSIMGLVGENGAGKSTVIKSILGLVYPDSGEIEVLGQKGSPDRAAKEQIGVVLDNYGFYDGLKIKDVARVMKELYTQWDDKQFQEYKKQFHLPENKKLKEFSKGMKQKLSLALALSHNASLLILDEATSGLDPIVRDEILDILLEFIQDETHSVLISSHIISDLEKVADYITFIHEGTIVFSENKDELLENYGVVKCTEQDYKAMDKTHVTAVRNSRFSYEVMINNKNEFIWQHKDLVVDDTTIEEIILFKVKGGL